MVCCTCLRYELQAVSSASKHRVPESHLQLTMATRAIVSARKGMRDGMAKLQESSGPCREKCSQRAAACEKAVGRVVSLRLLYFWSAAFTAGLAGLLFVLGLGVPPAMANALTQEIRASVIATNKVPLATALTGGKVIPETCEWSTRESMRLQFPLHPEPRNRFVPSP